MQVLQNGVPVGANRARDDSWPTSLTYAQYGSGGDTWGASWTADDIRSAGFGISITPQYTGPAAGNERGYIDSANVVIFFRPPCAGVGAEGGD